MKLALALATILLVGIPLGGQDAVKDAPRIGQCRTDQALWDSKLIEIARGSAKGTDDATVETLTNWIHEMRGCAGVDHEHAPAYVRTVALAMAAVGVRATDFLQRHNLMEQFVKEDMEGLR
jgi:hypothetical protein